MTICDCCMDLTRSAESREITYNNGQIGKVDLCEYCNRAYLDSIARVVLAFKRSPTISDDFVKAIFPEGRPK